MLIYGGRRRKGGSRAVTLRAMTDAPQEREGPPPSYGRVLARLGVVPDGAPISSAGSWVAPVRRGDLPAMLKIPRIDEERRGGRLLEWWAGDGAAPVLDRDGDALLLARAMGDGDLAAMSLAGSEGDDAATGVICGVVARLHAPRPGVLPELQPLAERFRSLGEAAASGSIEVLRAAWRTARGLLDDGSRPVPLHGDVHHGNILDFGPRGWCAIDPKGLVGAREYDYANTFLNPGGSPALSRSGLDRRLDVVASHAGIDRDRMLRWVLAHAGLSMAWHLEDGTDPSAALTMAEIASAALGG